MYLAYHKYLQTQYAGSQNKFDDHWPTDNKSQRLLRIKIVNQPSLIHLHYKN